MTADTQIFANSTQLPITTPHSPTTCAMCGLPATRHITETFNQQELTFCCYGCRHVYEVIAPDLAAGMDVRAAIGKAGLDINAPCCHGIIHGDPADEAKRILSRLMLNAFLGMMVMVLSIALYSDLFFDEGSVSGWLGSVTAQNVRSILQGISMLFATPAVLMLALPILEDAIYTWQIYRRLTTSALIAVGTLAAYGLSVFTTFTGQGHAYFETVTMTLLLVTLGRWLDARAQVEGSQALDELLARTPAEASLISAEGEESRVPVEQLRVGNHIRIRPGENFAVDGRVLSGEGSVNQANITGEATPVYKGPGHTVYAGTTNLDGSFVVEAIQVGEERVMGKLVRLLDEARLHRAPIERLADRVSGYFVPTVLVLAVITLVYWTWQVNLEQGLMTSLAVLLIACPCALGIATPLAIWAALGRAARSGVLIRDSAILEKLSHVRRVFFDKTGTLTTGEATLAEIVVANSAVSKTQLLQMVASLEHSSEHPLARSIQAAAAIQQLPLFPIEGFKAMPGLGISGQVQNLDLIVGSWRLVQQSKLVLSESLRAERQRLEQAGLSVVYVGWQGQVQGLFGLTETLRPAAATALAYMQQQDLAVEALTGDSATAGAALSQRLGIPVRSELLPHDKVSAIEQAEMTGPVAMVGDGLNDAPALARASVGIALGCGADVTREAADVSLLGNDLAQITWTLTLARRAYQTIGWNLLWAFLYNVIGVAIAMAGLLHPILAAVAMVISSAMVVGNSLRVFRFS